MIRRMASRRSTKSNSSKVRLHPENPFFSASERNLARTRSPRNDSSAAINHHSGDDEVEISEEMRVVSGEAAASQNGNGNANGAATGSEAKPSGVRFRFSFCACGKVRLTRELCFVEPVVEVPWWRVRVDT